MRRIIAWNWVAGMLALLGLVARAENWPCWRGPRLDGTSLEKRVPACWNAASNLLWKTELPGSGHASPIVWERNVFTVAALPQSQARLLLCLDRDTGKLSWQRTVLEAPLERKHSLNSYASSTPATDGKLVCVAFLDRAQMLVAAYDFVGNRIWLTRPGAFSSMHGFCSSPILYQDKVILNGDHDGDSYIVALSRGDGRTLWKTPRRNKTRSYCAPIIRELAGRPQLLLSGDKCVASYDPNNGRLLWMIDGPTDQFVASMVYHPGLDLLFVTGGFPEHHILALKPDARGNATPDRIIWRTTRGVAYVPSPILERNYFLVVSDSGVTHCFEAATGEILWAERTGEQHASIVSANGLVYCLNDAGVTHVFKPGSRMVRVAQNPIQERCFASPAISQGRIFLRGDKHLFCIGTPGNL